MNIYTELNELNHGELDSILDKENLLSLILESNNSTIINLDKKVDFLDRNLHTIQSCFLSYLYHLRYFQPCDDNSLNEKFIATLMSSLDYTSSSIRYTPDISLFDLIVSANKYPFTSSSSTIVDKEDLLELLSIFGHKFIHSDILDEITNNYDHDEFSDDISENFDDSMDYYSEIFDLSICSRDISNFSIKKDILKPGQISLVSSLAEYGILNIKVFRIFSDEISNFIEANINNTIIINTLLDSFYHLLPYYYGSIMSLSSPIIIDKSSKFHDDRQKYNLLFATLVTNTLSDEIIDFFPDDLKIAGYHSEIVLNLLKDYTK